MKSIILFVLFIGILFNVKSQEKEEIFSYDNEQFVVKEKFIDSLYVDDAMNDISYQLVKSSPISLLGKQQGYDVNLGSYFEGEPGDFNEIEIKFAEGGTQILKVFQINRWKKIPDKFKTFSTNEYFIPIYLDSTTMALVFWGYHYNSEPPLLTIVVIHNGKAKLVFNKQFIVKEIREIEGKTYFLLYDRVFEYVSGDVPVNEAVMYGIWNENGVLYFGGPYGTTKQ